MISACRNSRIILEACGAETAGGATHGHGENLGAGATALAPGHQRERLQGFLEKEWKQSSSKLPTRDISAGTIRWREPDGALTSASGGRRMTSQRAAK